MGKNKRHVVFKNCLKKVSQLLLREVDELIEEELNREKRIWTRKWLQRRDTHGASALLLTELATEDVKEYMTALRMTPNDFNSLLEFVSPTIERQNTLMRDSLPPHIKLEITLNFLATGNSYRSLQHLFRVSKSAISKFIPEVCEAIFESLKDFIKVS